jgi:drug/metabolite transporter (DMT)-like permease
MHGSRPGSIFARAVRINISNMKSAPAHSTAVVLLVITALLWSMGGVLIKSVQWHPLAIAGGRAACAAVVMLCSILFLEKRRPHFHFSFAQVGGALCYAATVSLYVSANKLTTNANAIVLQYTAPIYIVLFGAWFLGEQVQKRDVIATGVVLAGMTLFFVDKLTADNTLGIVLAVLSGVSMGWMVLFLRRQKETSSIESMLLGNILTLLIGIPFMLDSPVPDVQGLSYVAILGVVQIGIPYVLYAHALKSATAMEGVVLTMLEPILSPVWVMIVLRETPGPWALLGGAIVLVAVTVRAVLAARRAEV